MAISANRVTVQTTPTLLTPTADVSGISGQSVAIKNVGGNATVFIGGANVNIGTGYALAGGDTMFIDLASTDFLYGIVATGTVILSVIQVGV